MTDIQKPIDRLREHIRHIPERQAWADFLAMEREIEELAHELNSVRQANLGLLDAVRDAADGLEQVRAELANTQADLSAMTNRHDALVRLREGDIEYRNHGYKMARIHKARYDALLSGCDLPEREKGESDV